MTFHRAALITVTLGLGAVARLLFERWVSWSLEPEGPMDRGGWECAPDRTEWTEPHR